MNPHKNSSSYLFVVFSFYCHVGAITTVIPERSEGYKLVPIELFVRGVCVVPKSADLAYFQPAISPVWRKLCLPNTRQAQRMPSATQAWATRARVIASACLTYLAPKVRGLEPPRLAWLQQLVLTLTATQASGISGHATTRFGEINRRHSPWVCVGSHVVGDWW